MMFNHPVWLNRGVGCGSEYNYKDKQLRWIGDGSGSGYGQHSLNGDMPCRGNGEFPFGTFNPPDDLRLIRVNRVLHYLGSHWGDGRSNHR